VVDIALACRCELAGAGDGQRQQCAGGLEIPCSFHDALSLCGGFEGADYFAGCFWRHGVAGHVDGQPVASGALVALREGHCAHYLVGV